MDGDQGLRGMNWSTSIAQLVCVFLMTVLRAIIRRGLIITPVSKKVLDQHEMDWLALRIVWNPSPPGKSKPPQHLDECNFWPKDEDEFRPDEGCQKDASPGNGRETEDENFLSKERWIWTIPTNHQNYAYAGTWDFINLPPSDEAQKALGVRRRLGQLTKWVGIASKLSIAVASAIDIVMNTLFNDSKEKVFVWYMKALIDEKEQKVHFKVQKDKDKWKTNATDIEAALSLWIFHIHYTKTKSKTNKIESGDDSDWLRRDVEPKREIIRLLGSDTKELRRDINWWIGDGIVGDNTNNSDLGESIGFTGVVGFKGMEPQDQTSGKPSNHRSCQLYYSF
jgi:hypothetical protein